MPPKYVNIAYALSEALVTATFFAWTKPDWLSPPLVV
jgi:hypothetical protein